MGEAMRSFLLKLLTRNWQRKVIAIAVAIVLWFLVNHSITATRKIPNIAVRVIHLPAHTTAVGMQPDGLLDRKMTVRLTGTKSLIDKLEPKDLEIIADAQGKGNEWAVEVNKDSLVSLNPDLDFGRGITEVSADDLVVRLDYYRDERLSLQTALPIHLFVPTAALAVVQPASLVVKPNNLVTLREGVPLFTAPLYVQGVSRLFLDLIQPNLELLITLTSTGTTPQWEFNVVDVKHLEDLYVASFALLTDPTLQRLDPLVRDTTLRSRFQIYLQRMRFVTASGSLLILQVRLNERILEIVTP